MNMRSILNQLINLQRFYHPEGIVCLDKSAAFLDEEDFDRVREFLDYNKIKYQCSRNHSTGLSIIELK